MNAKHHRKWVGLVAALGLAGLIVPCSAAPADDLEVMTGGKVVKNGGSWFIPMNSSSNKVALFSEQRERFSIYNKSKGPMVIESIALVREKGVLAEELTLQNTDLKPKPLAFKKTAVAPKKSFDFYVRLYPVQSRQLGGTVNIGYAGGKKYTFAVKGRGRDKAIFTKRFTTARHMLLGGAKTDEMVTGMVADKAGNIYFAGQVTGLKDRFAYDLFYGRINADGSLAWGKLWAGPFRDYTRDPGQNDETGGSSNAIDIDEDGYIYLTGSVSPSKQNNNFAALILKIDPKSGKIVWEKLWRPAWPSALLAKHSAEAYALDVHGGRVYVVGTTGAAIQNANALVFLLCISAKDGALEFQRYVDPTPRSTDRAYSVRAAGKGNVYVAGLAAKISLLIKFTAANTTSPKVAWAKTLSTGWGSNINCLDVDAAGNVYAAVDRRGAKTHLSFLKLSPKGDLVWGRTYDGGSNKNNNCACIKVVGDALFVGGRTGQSWYDAQMGDAKLIKVSAKDGKELWSAFYFTGKGPDELGEHRVKGIAIRGKTIHLLGQVYTASMNGVRYWGYWYDGVSKLSDYKPGIKDLGMKEGSGKDISAGKLKDASGARTLVDLAKLVPWQDAAAKHDGHGPDAEMIYWKLEAK